MSRSSLFLRYPFLILLAIGCGISGALWVVEALGAPPAVRVSVAFLGWVVLLGAWFRQRGRDIWRRRQVARAGGRAGGPRPPTPPPTRAGV